jgi:tRNA 5-methylaminomethyl-2-thiouridine biosynthesis bifunctional protein
VSTAAPALLPSSAPDLPVWRVLDTCFDPARLLSLWQAWLAMPSRPRVLHVVALAAAAPDRAMLRAAASAAQQALAEELGAQWWGLLPGQHRFALQDGRLQFTLCVGERQASLREQQFEADAVLLDTTQGWDRWQLKALARCCRRGAAVQAWPATDDLPAELRQAGFIQRGTALSYDPPWTLKAARETLRTEAASPSTCAVVGAGLAGASVAAVLARRGWQVQVLDGAPHPAAGASGLPAGLLVPHVSSDDSPRSRLTRAGLRLMRAEAQRLLVRGADWQPGGVLERRLDGHPGLPTDWPAAGQEISSAATADLAAPWRAGTAPSLELWHAQAAWLKPARLVRAWLQEPGVQFVGNARVHALRRQDARWELLDRSGQVLARAAQVVLANAVDATRLVREVPGATLDELPAVHEMRGVLSWGLHRPDIESALPPFPVNGLGSLIPAVPTDEGLAWYAGATYEAADQAPAPAAEHHRVNHDKLRTLLPAAAEALAPAFEAGAARGWGNTRCVSADRLPLVGPLEDGPAPTLWISAAMGSRGLSFAMLCAELLVARLGAEPWPVEASLARFLAARRRPAA